MAWQHEPNHYRANQHGPDWRVHNPPHAYPPAEGYRLPGGLKALAIVVSLVKAIPLALGLIVVAFAGLFSGAIIGRRLR